MFARARAALCVAHLLLALDSFAQSAPPAQFLGRAERPAAKAARPSPPGLENMEGLPRVLNLGPIPVVPDQSPNPRGLRQTGISRSIPQDVMASGTHHMLPGGHSIWRLIIDTPGATGVRLHFTNFSIGAGLVWIYPADRPVASQFVDGPYTGRGPHNDGTFFTGVIESSRITIEYLNPILGSTDSPPPFLLDFLVHLWGESQAVFENSPRESLSLPGVTQPDVKPSLLEYTSPPITEPRTLASCHLDVNCYPQYASSAGGVVGLSFVGDDGKSYVCSGAMINTRSSNFVPTC